ncbi:hypothetical protein EHEL_020530 [Encephalitozoon hellem ATCC 50504]|uniref:Uncharacterized protein n=1 Tax=Encephalitozoon hellem TaxID=27973 RepID=A0A9Q9C1Y6_ENCHE|nr:uncharacterized protein EHEL_020530 [Encephalitozoon hellem ATCC 50504]AFM97809.1 hypothetical protein EHEL_020530 [Encephalitozoon hellem ATCC 50504]UTX42581.1 hypothetical protein GPU96_02g02930 [Encephalitozoon hellem]|eukprot:XP_003886790.1 hypothetical protein EHEL_020530 [Encephalitozoon hellem ATCC 50504]
MEISLEVQRIETLKRITSTRIRYLPSTETVWLDDFALTIPIYGSGGERYEYTGSVFSKTADILAKFERKMNLGLVCEEGMEMLKNGDKPILRCLYKDGNDIKICGLRRLMIIDPRDFAVSTSFTKVILRDQSRLNMLRKLSLVNCKIKKVPDLSTMRLKYLDLSHNSISGVLCIRGYFNTVNLSHNKISRVIRMKALNFNVSHNRVTRFFEDFRYQRLNLSHNPLEFCRAEARVLDLSRTMVKMLESKITKKLTIDGTKGVSLGKFESLVFLSINDCGMRCLSFDAKRLRVLKARNNFIEEVPFFPSLEYLDISGNLVHTLPNKGVKFLDASKNQIIAFDLSEWGGLEHLDLSYNPLVNLEASNRHGLKYLNLKGTSIRKGAERKKPRRHVHQCRGEGRVVERFVIDPKEVEGRLFLISVHDPKIDIFEMLKAIQSEVDETCNPHTYLWRFCYLLRKMLFSRSIRPEYALCMTTSKHVILNGRGVGFIFSNFAEIKIFDDPEVVEIYDNVGNWHFIPVFCDFQGNVARLDILDTIENRLDSVLDFIGHRCALSATTAISSTSGLCKDLCVGVRLISRTSLPCKLSYEDAIKSISKKKSNESSIHGSENYNFVLKSSTRRFYGTLLLNPNPIFAFCRILPRDRSHGYVIGNVANIMKMISIIFSGTRIEFFSRIWIVAFHDRVEACLWGLKVKEMLRCLEIDVGIGITCGTFYTRIAGSHVRFYGPVLSKASRVANLGVGVFCCHCVWTKHSGIMYINQGQRFLRGFKEPHLIYTPHISGEI